MNSEIITIKISRHKLIDGVNNHALYYGEAGFFGEWHVLIEKHGE